MLLVTPRWSTEDSKTIRRAYHSRATFTRKKVGLQMVSFVSCWCQHGPLYKTYRIDVRYLRVYSVHPRVRNSPTFWWFSLCLCLSKIIYRNKARRISFWVETAGERTYDTLGIYILTCEAHSQCSELVKAEQSDMVVWDHHQRTGSSTYKGPPSLFLIESFDTCMMRPISSFFYRGYVS